jgi:hypothetical protein
MLFWFFCCAVATAFVVGVFFSIAWKNITILSATFCICLALCIPLMIMISEHAYDLSIVRNEEQIISVHETAIQEIDTQLKGMDIKNTSLMNADSPTRSLIEAKAEFVKRLTEARSRVVNARVRISARSIGVASGVVTVYGKE